MTKNALMRIPLPLRNPDRMPSTDPLHEERRRNLAMLLAELDEVPMPEGTTPLEPIDVVDPDAPEPESMSNQELAIALAGRFGRNMIPGGSRLAANMFAGEGQDPMQLLQQYNDQDDAVFAQAPVASVASDMAGMMVPLGAVASGMRRYVDAATRFPKVVNALSRPGAMAATGAAYGVTDQAYDRPDDGNLGTAAVMGGISGFGGAALPPLGAGIKNALRRKYFPNHWEREADSMGRIIQENQRRRLQEHEAIAGAGHPTPPQNIRCHGSGRAAFRPCSSFCSSSTRSTIACSGSTNRATFSRRLCTKCVWSSSGNGPKAAINSWVSARSSCSSSVIACSSRFARWLGSYAAVRPHASSWRKPNPQRDSIYKGA